MGLCAAAPLSLSFPIGILCKVLGRFHGFHTQLSALGLTLGKLWQVQILCLPVMLTESGAHTFGEQAMPPQQIKPPFANPNKPRDGRDQLHPFPGPGN